MENDTKRGTFDLSAFKKATSDMIALNDTAWKDGQLSTRGRYKKNYTLEQVKTIVDSGSNLQKIDLSRNFCLKDGFYKRIVIYYASLLKYIGIMIPNPGPGKSLSDKIVQKKYHAAMSFIEELSLPTLFADFAFRVLRDGCYYGVIRDEGKKDFGILDLPTEYCEFRFKDIKGNPAIDFDVSYFDTILVEKTRKETLDVYPKCISQFYNAWKKRGQVTLDAKWFRIPSDISVCFPFFGNVPFLLDVIPATMQYDEAVETERERDLEEIRKIIVQKIPHLSEGTLLFEPDEALEIHQGTVAMMKGNPNVSVLTTYAEVDSIASKTSTDTVRNNLEKMAQNVYNEAGVSSQLFSAQGNLAVDISIKNDTALMMNLGNKFANFLTNLLNKKFANVQVDFKYVLLPITYYNESDYISDTFKLAQSGYSFILPALACGINQRDLSNVKDLENNLLNLSKKLLPLESAYTKASEGSGAPEKANDKKSPKTLENEESLDKQGGRE